MGMATNATHPTWGEWGTDDLTPAELAFAEAVAEAYDPWQVVTEADAARAAGVAAEWARGAVRRLKARRCWPYRNAQWRRELARTGRLGPFGPRAGEWGRRAG